MVHIIGGGITGAFTAYLLAQQGMACTLITNNDSNMASAINPGGINPLHGPGIPGVMETFSMQAYHLHLQHWHNIRQLSGVDFDGRIIERLLLAFNDQEKQQLLANQKLYQQHTGFAAQWLEPAEIAARDNRLSQHATGGLYTRGNATVDAGLYTRAVLLAAQALGATVVEDTVTTITANAKGYTVECRHHTYATAQLVVAAGAHSRDLLQGLGLDIPVTPVKGELLLVEISGPPFAFDITRDKDGLYQYHGNVFWLGGTREEAGFDYSVGADSAAAMLDNAAVLVPGIRQYQVTAHRAAMRPGTPDGLPIVGEPKACPGLFVATGGGSKGMLWSAGLAASVVNLLAGKACDPAIAFLSPDRFSGRN